MICILAEQDGIYPVEKFSWETILCKTSVLFALEGSGAQRYSQGDQLMLRRL
ncbi:hypothetical protein EXN66_Car020896 [Channa argus]|uniref:Uncharacterized protein n=1 Tax=Channa argus TaxID=215402 RepID=A0A6G1QRM7_CHAAH|nr:hypothetical protein EXN66_Car020896 [Channa argus]